MFTATDFHELVSGRKQGLPAAICRTVLRFAEYPYGLAVRQRNRRFDRDGGLIQRVRVPVISVGNITTGGTGKTPMVAWLARWFRQRDRRVAIVSRGYGAEKGSLNDEALELEQQLPDVPHAQNPDRVLAAETAITEFESQVIVLDDAFQHRRIHRDLDLVLIDALEPFGYGHLLPRGLLREPLEGLRRADIVALTRADMVDANRRVQIRQSVREHAGGAVWIELAHQPQLLLNSSGKTADLVSLRDVPLGAFCGIGNPEGFQHTLQSCGYQVKAFQALNDHHRYQREDIDELQQLASGIGDEAPLLCTHKDLVKIGVDHIGRHPVWAVTVQLQVISGAEQLEERLLQLLPASVTAGKDASDPGSSVGPD